MYTVNITKLYHVIQYYSDSLKYTISFVVTGEVSFILRITYQNDLYYFRYIPMYNENSYICTCMFSKLWFRSKNIVPISRCNTYKIRVICIRCLPPVLFTAVRFDSIKSVLTLERKFNIKWNVARFKRVQKLCRSQQTFNFR